MVYIILLFFFIFRKQPKGNVKNIKPKTIFITRYDTHFHIMFNETFFYGNNNPDLLIKLIIYIQQ